MCRKHATFSTKASRNKSNPLHPIRRGFLSCKPSLCAPPRFSRRGTRQGPQLLQTSRHPARHSVPRRFPHGEVWRFSTPPSSGFRPLPQGRMQMTVLFLKPVPMRPLHSLSGRIMTECNSVNSKSSPGRCPLTSPELGDESRQPDLRQAAELSE